MTTATATTSVNTAPVRIDLAIPEVFPTLLKVSETIAAQGLDKKLHHLIHLRASADQRLRLLREDAPARSP